MRNYLDSNQKVVRQDFIIMVPQNDKWAELIENVTEKG